MITSSRLGKTRARVVASRTIRATPLRERVCNQREGGHVPHGERSRHVHHTSNVRRVADDGGGGVLLPQAALAQCAVHAGPPHASAHALLL